jgi:hypothetical protein
MNALQWFWTLALIIAGASFAIITVLVGVFGYRDLREMFAQLRRQGSGQP